MPTMRMTARRRRPQGPSRRPPVVVVLFIALLLAAACGGDDAGGGEGTLQWGIQDFFEPQAKELAAAYEKARPEVTVEVQPLPGAEQYLQRLLTARLSENLPDVMITFSGLANVFATNGVTADLRPVLEESEVLSEDYFTPAFLDAYVIDSGDHEGEIHGLPQGADATLVVYNKKMFEEANVPLPTDDWTWDEFLSAAKKLKKTRGGNTTWGAYVTPQWEPVFRPMIEAYGGEAFVQGEEGITAELDSEAALQAWQTLLQPILDGVFLPQDVARNANFDGVQLFSSGTVAMYFGTRPQVPALRDAMKEEWDVAPMPMVNGQRATGGGSVGLAMSSQADEALTQDFLSWYFSGDGGMKILQETYAFVPAIPALQGEDAVWRRLPAPPANAEAFVTAAEAATMAPGFPGTSFPAIEQAVINAIDEVTLKGGSIEEAFAEADDKADAAFEKAQQE